MHIAARLLGVGNLGGLGAALPANILREELSPF